MQREEKEASLADALLWAIVALYASSVALLAIVKHETVNSTIGDLAIFDQVIWNTAQGRFMEGSITVPHYFGEHLSPILALFATFYLLWADVRLLLVLQAVIIALGALPIYYLARCRLGSSSAALLIALSYLFYPNLAYMGLFDFHPEVVLFFLLPASFLALHRQRYVWFLILVGLMLLVKEDVALTIFAMGGYILVRRREKVLGLTVALVGLLWFFLSIEWVIPFFRQEPYLFYARYSHFGRSLPAILLSLVQRPGYVALILARPENATYLAQLLLPLAFLPLAQPLMAAMALPVLAGNMLANFGSQTSLAYQYSVPVVPIFFVAAIEAVAGFGPRLASLGPKPAASPRKSASKLVLPSLVLTATLAFGSQYHPFSDLLLATAQNKPPHQAFQKLLRCAAQAARPECFEKRDVRNALEDAAPLIPAEASLSASNTLGPHLAHRRQLYHFPGHGQKTEYVLVDTSDEWYTAAAGTSVAAELEKCCPAAMYEKVFEQQGIILLKLRQGGGL